MGAAQTEAQNKIWRTGRVPVLHTGYCSPELRLWLWLVFLSYHVAAAGAWGGVRAAAIRAQVQGGCDPDRAVAHTTGGCARHGTHSKVASDSTAGRVCGSTRWCKA